MGCECRVSLGYTVRSYLKKKVTWKRTIRKKNNSVSISSHLARVWKGPPRTVLPGGLGGGLGLLRATPRRPRPLRTVLPADLGPPRTVLLGGLGPLRAAPRRPWATQDCSPEALGCSGLLRAAPRWPLNPHSSLSLAHFFFMVILLLL